METIGINDEGASLSGHAKEVLDPFNQTIEMRNGRYCVNLRWKSQNIEDLNDNQAVAGTRLKQLYRNLLQNKEIEHDFDKAIRLYSESQYAEEINGT